MDPTSFGLVLDPLFERHDTGVGHPERPERLTLLRELFEKSGVTDRVTRVPLTRAEDASLLLCHDLEHIQRVDQACRNGERVLDGMDTAICPESAEIARHAAGTVVELCRRVAAGRLTAGFAAVRPPGHHAERDLAMGFCLFNTVAIAARWLTREGGLKRVMVFDWDVHHGNGTQHIFDDDPSVLYASVHQSPLYPGTGAATERGVGNALGTTVNCPLPPGSGDEAFLDAIANQVVPAAQGFKPEFILLSAGFDAHRADPLGGLEVSGEAFVEATRQMMTLSSELCDGRLVSVLEGGYDLNALAATALAHVTTMLG
ncbi:MAG: histone deacetylase [Acidobacteriota bacterium]|nr:histone deacetylase [Acidobacteriota bacterium]MDH3784664.1 histone deacetylase [Acidobacteriota bacterium]